VGEEDGVVVRAAAKGTEDRRWATLDEALPRSRRLSHAASRQAGFGGQQGRGGAQKALGPLLAHAGDNTPSDDFGGAKSLLDVHAVIIAQFSAAACTGTAAATDEKAVPSLS
jgi:hypothetical protein